jgi:hypothetical protein
MYKEIYDLFVPSRMLILHTDIHKKGEIYYLIYDKTFRQVTKTLGHYNRYFIFSTHQFLTWQQMYRTVYDSSSVFM